MQRSHNSIPLKAIIIVTIFVCQFALVSTQQQESITPCPKKFYTAQGRLLAKIDMTTGNTSIIGQLNGGDVKALEHDFYTGSRTFAMIDKFGTSILAHVNLRTASLSEIGATSVPDMYGLAMDDNEVLYTHSQHNNSLYELNPATGLATFVFETRAEGVVDMAYRPADGLIYATNLTHLFTFNVSSHQVNTLGPFRAKLGDRIRVSGIVFTPKSALFGIRGNSTRRIDHINLRTLKTRASSVTGLRRFTLGATLQCNKFRNPSRCLPNITATYQPNVTIVEGPPARKSWNSLSRPNSSWCGGLPTIWEVGHQPHNETPWCKQSDGSWVQLNIAVLDVTDDLNAADGAGGLDRHSCTYMDVDENGEPDIMCVVGANRGEGYGFSELYLTQTNGTLRKVKHHGLQSHPTLRGRFIVRVKGADGSKLILVISTGTERADTGTNVHYMYRVIPHFPYFLQVEDGPWQENFKPKCAMAADWDGDGIEDLIMCTRNSPAILIKQNISRQWTRVDVPDHKSLTQWNNVRVGDIDGDGRPDLVVVKGLLFGPSTLFIFSGIEEYPYFEFDSPYLMYPFEHRAADLELLDVNGDGLYDIYIVLNEADPKQYCGTEGPTKYWRERAGGGNRFPPNDWAPPSDKIPDILLLNRMGNNASSSFEAIKMEGCYPGCGSRAERYLDNKTMILSHGDPKRPGFGLLLEW